MVHLCFEGILCSLSIMNSRLIYLLSNISEQCLDLDLSSEHLT